MGRSKTACHAREGAERFAGPAEALRHDDEALAIIQKIEAMLQGKSLAIQKGILALVARDVEANLLVPEIMTMRVESLLVWDLVSRATYMEIQYRLNEFERCRAIPWEHRDVGMIDQLITDQAGFPPMKHMAAIELAHALTIVGHAGMNAADWCLRMLDQGKADGSYDRSLAALAERRARSEKSISIWRMRAEDRIRPEELADRHGMPIAAIRKRIIEGRALFERRSVLADPMDLQRGWLGI